MSKHILKLPKTGRARQQTICQGSIDTKKQHKAWAASAEEREQERTRNDGDVISGGCEREKPEEKMQKMGKAAEEEKESEQYSNRAIYTHKSDTTLG